MPWPDEPDTEEKILRLVCGALFGAMVGLLTALRWVPVKEWIIAGTVAGAFVCAISALKFGNTFWYSIRDWWIR
jgi:hypothetical protein